MLLGLFTDEGSCQRRGASRPSPTPGASTSLQELVEPVVTDEHGEAVKGETDLVPLHWKQGRQLRPAAARARRGGQVLRLEGARFRHAVTFLRWRPDREPESCTLDQVDRAIAYDLAEVLTR